MFKTHARPSIATDFCTIDDRSVRYRIVRPIDRTGTQKSDERLSTVKFPLILIHGLGCSAAAWEPSMRCLARRRLNQPVIAPDLPGFGNSPGPKAALSMQELADWIIRLMDELGIERAYMAGHSMGCQVLLALARRYPDRVAGLVLVGPTIGDHRVPFWRYAIGLFRDGFNESISYNLVLAHMYSQMGLVRYAKTVKKMMEDDPTSYAKEIHTPTLIMRGIGDKVIPAIASQKLALALPRGTFTVVEDAAHAVQFNQCELFSQISLAFWSGAEVMGTDAKTAPPPQ